ncbi:SET domain-containing protein [Artomyces pyxidatus]|uniref:SET domain-containing protein n=1 Tax=Artomyces pyxidatus TaxID=48021 RepID=A0ACB8TBT7_9AGAM|nr:SET domain-containing protein [Artomyces pyxidatus]
MRIPIPADFRPVFDDAAPGPSSVDLSASKYRVPLPLDSEKGVARVTETDDYEPIITQVPVPEETRPYNKLVVCVAFGDVKQELYAHGVAPYDAGVQKRYRITQVSGLGVGLVVTEDHAPGSVIVRECPLLVMPLFVLAANRAGIPVPSDLLVPAVKHLDDNEARLFRGLYNCHPTRGDEVEDLWNIMKTNAISIGSLPGFHGQYTAVYSDICRINHSCSPNAIYGWDLQSFTGEVRASRLIKKGEEVFITYIDNRGPYDVRQRQLQNTYNFTCACPACSLSEAERKRSDVRRSLLSRIWRSSPDSDVEAWMFDHKLPEDLIIKRFLRYADIMEQEMLSDAQWITIARALVMAYSALREVEGAKKWAKKAKEASLAASGKDQGWSEIARAPERTDWWGLRKLPVIPGATWTITAI